MSLILFPSDVAAEMGRLKSAADGVNQSVSACTTLDAATKSSWDAFYKDLTAFTAQHPAAVVWPWDSSGTVWTTAALGDTVVAYETALTAWQGTLSSKGCQATGPGFKPFEPTPPVPSGLTDAVKYAGIAVMFVAVAWGVSEVVKVIPKPAPKSPPPRLVKRAA